jgi:hypothetical protein
MSEENPDTIAERVSRAVSSALSRHSDADDVDDYGSSRGRVPYDRFKSAIDQRNQAREELAELGRQLHTLQTAYKTQLDGLKTHAATEVAALASRHQEDLSLVDAGIRDDLGRVAVRQAWEAQPEDARGKSPAMWWKQTLEAHAAHVANPEEAPKVDIPRILLGYMPDAPAAAPAPAPTSRQPPRVDKGATRKASSSVNDRLNALPPDATLADVLRAARGG